MSKPDTMKFLLQGLAILALVIVAGGRFTVAWQQLGGQPYAGSSIQENLILGAFSFGLGLLFLTLAARE